jgi:hypothetical protein
MSIALGFFITSAVLQLTWNYTMPKIIDSVHGEHPFKDINYETAMVFSVLLAVLFGGGGLLHYAPIQVGKKLSKYYHGKSDEHGKEHAKTSSKKKSTRYSDPISHDFY